MPDPRPLDGPPAGPDGDLDVRLFPPPRLDWRERLLAVVDATGVSRRTLVLSLSGLVLLAILAAVAVPQLLGSSTPAQVVDAALPMAEPEVASTTTSTPAELVVHVAGSVQRPGVVRVPAGSRWVDAVDAAGGALAHADLGRVNLAAPVGDGERVYVPAVGEDPPPPVEGPPAPDAPGGEAGGALVDLNTADAVELETLPGVGPATAAAIIDHREANGPFRVIDDLLAVRGIGPAKLEALRDHVRV